MPLYRDTHSDMFMPEKINPAGNQVGQPRRIRREQSLPNFSSLTIAGKKK
ncbi:MAG: hypothetical protein Q7U88_02485 [Desulfocapsaceae bacterium]|nr:hypothetical protein [Desulfocapsaceae bacterium]